MVEAALARQFRTSKPRAATFGRLFTDRVQSLVEAGVMDRPGYDTRG
jgi:hypothetical protein